MNIHDILLSLGIRIYQNVGKSEYRCVCPFCHSSHIKFYINNKTGKFICFNCSRTGTLTSLISALKGEDKQGAKTWLKHHKFVSPVVTEAQHQDAGLFDQLMYIDAKAQQEKYGTDLDSLRMPRLPTHCHYLMDNFKNPESYPFFNYAHRRGLTLDQIKSAHVSYVISGTFIKQNGHEGQVKNSLVFFAYYHGKPCYWNTRAIYDQIPKSLNAPGRNHEFSRRDAVFNLNNLKKGQNLVICEGIFNACMFDGRKFCGVCTYGKRITGNQIKEIASAANLFNLCYIGLDSDAFNLANPTADKLEKAGVPKSKIRIIDDRCLGSKDFNDLGRQKSLQLLKTHSKALTLSNYLKEMLP